MDAVDRIFELVSQKYREQKDFAAAISEPASRVSEWENRKSASYVKCIAKIAEAIAPIKIKSVLLRSMPSRIKSPKPPAPIREAKVAVPIISTVAV